MSSGQEIKFCKEQRSLCCVATATVERLKSKIKKISLKLISDQPVFHLSKAAHKLVATNSCKRANFGHCLLQESQSWNVSGRIFCFFDGRHQFSAEYYVLFSVVKLHALSAPASQYQRLQLLLAPPFFHKYRFMQCWFTCLVVVGRLCKQVE